jgi:hypothetical protein
MPFGFGLSLPVNSLMRGSGVPPGPIPTPALDLQFVGATTLDPRITFTRSTTGTFTNASGVLTSAAINAPRFDYDPATLQSKGLLIEPRRINIIRNNTMVGAVAGTPGTLPTNWSAQINTTTGLTSEVVGVGTDSGISYIDYRISGTASGAGSFEMFFDVQDISPSFFNETWIGSFYFKLQAGSTTGLSVPQVRFYDYNFINGFLGSTSVDISFPTSAALNTQRVVASYVIPIEETETQRLLVAFNIADGAAIDITFRIGMPQLEESDFVTSVIPTTSAQATRTADSPRMTGTNFSSWYNASTSTMLAEFQVVSALVSQNIFSFNDGTSNNRVTLATNSTSFAALRNTANAGAVVSPITAYAPTAGINKAALAFADFDVALCGNSGGVLTATNYAVPAVTQLQIGNQLGTLTTGFMTGHIRRLTYYSERLTNEQLRVITA